MRVFLAGDGSSDKVLQFPCQWLFRELGHQTDVLFLPEPSRPQPLRNRLEEALKGEPDLLLVHRDAEKELWKVRRAEIEAAVQSLEAAPGRTVGIVPVRMTEAWFLIDEDALRRAAGNPNGKNPLQMPALQNLEGLVDPKEVLYHNFRLASGLRGRQLSALRPSQCVHRLAELITDFSPLRRLAAFNELEAELREFLAR